MLVLGVVGAGAGSWIAVVVFGWLVGFDYDDDDDDDDDYHHQ